ncbi:hypothetical protein [Pseudomonas frederiksbergensis]|uniref:hypothetical protein n=1 Tax=Pseudomonas frederiksbergensis TaxID=104087 RepID=UPI000F483AEB|nr:hypothetical protein [Pseudomonas frederiksbergensis]RON54493.1 hypothetical protein BK667_13480 [Pseudomonas frederiksbergensis]
MADTCQHSAQQSQFAELLHGSSSLNTLKKFIKNEVSAVPKNPHIIPYIESTDRPLQTKKAPLIKQRFFYAFLQRPRYLPIFSPCSPLLNLRQHSKIHIPLAMGNGVQQVVADHVCRGHLNRHLLGSSKNQVNVFEPQ